MIRWVLAFLLLGAPAQAAELTVRTAGAFKTVAPALIPAFEADTGNKVTLRNDTVGALVPNLKTSEPFDVVRMSPSGIEALTNAGKINPGTAGPAARSLLTEKGMMPPRSLACLTFALDA